MIVPAPPGAEPPADSPPFDDEEAEAHDEFANLGIDLGYSSPLDIHSEARAVAPSPVPPRRLAEDDEAFAFLRQRESATDPEFEPLAAPDLSRLPDLIPPDPDPEPEFEPDSADAEPEPEPEPLIQAPPEPLTPRTARTHHPRSTPALDRRRDVAIPRTALVAWSLFALLALAFAFVAGLLIGHYRWR